MVSNVDTPGLSVAPRYSAPADSLVIGDGTSYDFPGETPVQFVTALPQTADAKVDLAPTQLGRPPYRYQPLADGQFPLALISPANNKMVPKRPHVYGPMSSHHQRRLAEALASTTPESTCGRAED